MKKLITIFIASLLLAACSTPKEPKPEDKRTRTTIIVLPSNEQVTVQATSCNFQYNQGSRLICWGHLEWDVDTLTGNWVLVYSNDAIVFDGQAQSYRVEEKEEQEEVK